MASPSQTDHVPIIPLVVRRERPVETDVAVPTSDAGGPGHGYGPFWDALPLSENRYDLKRQLAKGGMAALHLAHDRLLRRDVALKIVRQSLMDTPSAVIRFMQEGQIHAQLTHAGIPPLHDFGRFADGRPFLAMKFVKGHTLTDYVVSPKRPDRDELLNLFEQLCETVAYAHGKRIIHRDLTPNNVLINTANKIKVIDWGLAKVLQRSRPTDEWLAGADGTDLVTFENLARTAEGFALGTPTYLSPEQANGQIDRIDERTDVFGLGAILSFLLTGETLYRGSLSEVREQSRSGNLSAAFRRLDEGDIPDPLVTLTKVCLAPNVEHRPPNAAIVCALVRAARKFNPHEMLRQLSS